MGIGDRLISILLSDFVLFLIFCFYTGWLTLDLWHGHVIRALAHALVVGMNGTTWLLRRDRKHRPDTPSNGG